MTTDPSTVVLYVGGTGRSGSTMLANLLGEVPGYVSVGELRFLWERGMVEDRTCGCGASFSECPFWREVLDRAFGGQRPDPYLVQSALRSRTRLRSLPRVLRDRRSRSLRGGADGVISQRSFLDDDLSALYRAVADVAGARVVVDSSKLPTYAALIDGLAHVDVRLLHLVRDPRAAAFSWQRRKELTDRKAPGYMEQRGVTKSALLWTIWNFALERMWRGRQGTYKRLTYEELVHDPAPTMQAIVRWVGQGGDPRACFTGERSVRFGVHHTVAGNPSRMAQGDVSLTLDDEWTRGLDPRSRRLVGVMTRPLLRRYGYATPGAVETATVD